MKKVFLPVSEITNPFFDEIIKETKTTQYNFGSLDEDVSGFDAVLIHWPESLFNWKEPSLDEINELRHTLKKWKQKLKIVHVVHNEHPHNRNTENFKQLYHLILISSDVVVHLGEYSKKKYELEYPKAEHIVLEHPLYASSLQVFDKEFARKKLGIQNNEFMIIVAGSIRTLNERKLILKSFSRLKAKNKLLVVPRMFRVKIKPFKGYYKLRKLLPVDQIHSFFVNKEYSKKYKFDYRFIKEEELSLLMSAADVLFIPRLTNLNSGNTFLGLTYKKLIVGPNNGNTAEFLDRHRMLSYDVKNTNSISVALNKAHKIYKDYKIQDTEIAYLHPKEIAHKWDQLFLKL